MKLIKTSFYSGIITIAKFATGFIANKLVAIYSGAYGVALVGQFTNFIQVINILGGGAIQNGIVKYVAEYKNNEENLNLIFKSSLTISIIFGICTSTFFLIFNFFFPSFLFSTNQLFDHIEIIIVVSIFLNIIYVIYSSWLNGLGMIKQLTFLNLISNFSAILITYFCTVNFKLRGAFFSLFVIILLNSLFSIVYYFGFKNIKFSLTSLFKPNKFNKKIVFFSLMALVSLVLTPLTQIIVRIIIEHRFGVEVSGLWQGMTRITDGYLSIIITTLSIYYLPKLSSLKNSIDIKKEVVQGYKLITPLVCIISFFVYKFRFQIISILYTPDFLEMNKLFFYQTIGGVFKISSWLLSFIMVSKAMTKLFVITEVLFSLTYILFVYIFTQSYTFEGLSLAYLVNYLLYFLFFIVYSKKIISYNA